MIDSQGKERPRRNAKNSSKPLSEVYHEFERTIYEAIDYVREAANVKRFKEMFKV